MTVINNFNGDHFFLSNFYPAEIFYGGITYPTSEHAYQAAKTEDGTAKLRVVVATTPREAKRLGRKVLLRDDWEEVKLQVMEDILRAKFSSKKLAQRLVATGDTELIEGNWWGDTFWGICKDVGENHLGKLLMKLRTELKS